MEWNQEAMRQLLSVNGVRKAGGLVKKMHKSPVAQMQLRESPTSPQYFEYNNKKWGPPNILQASYSTEDVSKHLPTKTMMETERGKAVMAQKEWKFPVNKDWLVVAPTEAEKVWLFEIWM